MYLTAQEYRDRFGDAETIRLTDENRTGAVDSERLETAIGDAQEEVDSYLGKRYATPLASAPNLVRGFVAVLARENLHRRAGMVISPPLEKDAERVRSQLRDISRGLMTLPTADGAAVEDGRAEADSATSGDYTGPTFSEESLAGFGVPSGYAVARWRQ